MWQYNHTDELYHYGVKGMKWGVRRNSKAYQRMERRVTRFGERWENRAEGAKNLGKRAVNRAKNKVKLAGKVSLWILKNNPVTKIGEFAVKRIVKTSDKLLNKSAAIVNTTSAAIKGRKKAQEMLNNNE